MLAFLCAESEHECKDSHVYDRQSERDEIVERPESQLGELCRHQRGRERAKSIEGVQHGKPSGNIVAVSRYEAVRG